MLDLKRFLFPQYDRMSLRNDRLLKEIQMMAPLFAGGIDYDEQGFDWIRVPQYMLPERLDEGWCQLLVVPPVTYPETPPVGFYVDRQLHVDGGVNERNAIGYAAYGAADLRAQGWYWYCVTINNGGGGWRPSYDYRRPDNLHTFFDLIRETLTSTF